MVTTALPLAAAIVEMVWIARGHAPLGAGWLTLAAVTAGAIRTFHAREGAVLAVVGTAAAVAGSLLATPLAHGAAVVVMLSAGALPRATWRPAMAVLAAWTLLFGLAESWTWHGAIAVSTTFSSYGPSGSGLIPAGALLLMGAGLSVEDRRLRPLAWAAAAALATVIASVASARLAHPYVFTECSGALGAALAAGAVLWVRRTGAAHETAR